MTSAAATSSSPARKAPVPALRRLSRNVLIIGTVVSLLAAFGPTWAARAGIVIAVVAAVVACVVAWTELSQAHRAHASELLAATQAHGRALTEERRHNASVLDVLDRRAKNAAAEIVTHRRSIAQLHSEISESAGRQRRP